MSARVLAGVAAVLTLVVVAASAAIRLGGDELGSALAWIRGTHRAAASLAAVLILVLFLRSLRMRELRAASTMAFLLMLALSAVGWATGMRPPLWAAVFNQAGGVALAALLAWIAGRGAPSAEATTADRALAAVALALALLQLALGVVLGAFASAAGLPLTLAHAVLGIATATVAAATGMRMPGPGIVVCAIAAVIAGAASALPDTGTPVPVLHAAASALLIAALAHTTGRLARTA